MEEECQTEMEQSGAKQSSFISAPKFKSLTADFYWFSNFSVTTQATIKEWSRKRAKEEIWILYVGSTGSRSWDMKTSKHHWNGPRQFNQTAFSCPRYSSFLTDECPHGLFLNTTTKHDVKQRGRENKWLLLEDDARGFGTRSRWRADSSSSWRMELLKDDVLGVVQIGSAFFHLLSGCRQEPGTPAAPEVKAPCSRQVWLWGGVRGRRRGERLDSAVWVRPHQHEELICTGRIFLGTFSEMQESHLFDAEETDIIIQNDVTSIYSNTAIPTATSLTWLNLSADGLFKASQQYIVGVKRVCAELPVLSQMGPATQEGGTPQ